MITSDLINKIKSGEIKSRRQLYKIVGRSKKLRLWLNEQELLIPKWRNKIQFEKEMKDLYTKLNRLPSSSDNWRLTSTGQKLYGSWNKALMAIFGEKNQNRYNLNKNIASSIIYDFVKKEQRLPLREEFNGNENPYWEAITTTLEVSKWSDIFKYVDLTNVSYFNNSYHGTGKIYFYDNNVFLSNQEYLIGKWLHENNIKYEKEVSYKNSNHIFDFYLPEKNVYIEYYGLSHTNHYKKKIKEKRSLYNGRKVIEIFKHDNTIKKLAEEVQRL
ncbi:MAG: hypothetical protein ACOCV1_05875 [Bacillota bacterium]